MLFPLFSSFELYYKRKGRLKLILQKEKFNHKSSVTTENNLFEPLPFFMLRAPFLPTHTFDQLKDEAVLVEKLRAYAEKDYVKEAIAIASPSLLNSLHYIHGDLNNRKTQQVLSSMLRYMLRMTTRPTPFGAFSGVAAGQFKKNSSLKIDHFKEFKKRARPDMEWLLGVISVLERSNILPSLIVDKNRASYVVGDRLHLPFSTECGQLRKKGMEKRENISIIYSEVVEKVLNLAEERITVREITQRLHTIYPNTDVTIIQRFIIQLLEQEYLITELRPPLTIDNPFNYLIRKLEEKDEKIELYEELLKVRELINTYNQLPLGEGLSLYSDLISQMRHIYEVTTPLQVDFSLNATDLTIGEKVGEDISKAAQILWSIADEGVGFPHLQKYHVDFLEKYGTSREVPLLELLSEELGLGAPASYQNPHGKRGGDTTTSSINQERNSQLSYLLIKAIHNQEKEIEITEEIAQRMSKEKDRRYAPDSLEVYGELHAASQEDLDQGNYTFCLSPNPGSNALGSTFGRFLDILDPDVSLKIQQYQQKIDLEFNEDTVMVEGSFLPATGRSANVAIGKTTRKVNVTLGTNGDEETIQLPIDDIVVGASLENFYMKSKKLGKRIKVVAGNMLNYQSAPNIYRFMREISLNDLDQWRPFNWGSMAHSPYYPRIRYKNIVLSPGIWKLNKEIFGMREKPQNEEEFFKAFGEWREKWSVPRNVFMTYGDNRILIDLENTLHLRELKNELFKQGRLQLRETLQDRDQNCLNSPLGRHAVEIVVPLKKTENTERRKKIGAIGEAKKDIVSNKIIYKLPGSEWLYVKLYAPNARENDLILKYLTPFASEMVKSDMASSWFFMRYRDPDAHIRLRFQGDPSKLSGLVLPRLREWADKLIDLGLLQKITIDTYEREVERYGGPMLIEKAEDYFHYDSQSVAMILSTLNQQNHLPAYVMASLSIIDIMDNFGLNYAQQVASIENNTEKYEYIDEFRPLRKELSLIGDSRNDWENLRNYNSGVGKSIYESFLIRKESLTRYVTEIKELQKRDMLWNEHQMIMGAIIHMYCNRLLGANRELEKKALAFTRHILSSQKYWRNKNEEYARSYNGK
jgi:lantibiotic biosynthesis protein